MSESKFQHQRQPPLADFRERIETLEKTLADFCRDWKNEHEERAAIEAAFQRRIDALSKAHTARFSTLAEAVERLKKEYWKNILPIESMPKPQPTRRESRNKCGSCGCAYSPGECVAVSQRQGWMVCPQCKAPLIRGAEPCESREPKESADGYAQKIPPGHVCECSNFITPWNNPTGRCKACEERAADSSPAIPPLPEHPRFRLHCPYTSHNLMHLQRAEFLVYPTDCGPEWLSIEVLPSHVLEEACAIACCAWLDKSVQHAGVDDLKCGQSAINAEAWRAYGAGRKS